MGSKVDPIEIKANIGGDVDEALTRLGLESGAGREREIWFLDDLTEGLAPALPLLNSGVILRLRRPKEHGGKEDSTVKLRPCRRSQLVSMWDTSRKHDPEYRIEGDWSRKRHALAASCVAELKPGTIDRALDGAVSGLFSEPQRAFLSDCSDIRFTFTGVSVLGPIASMQWKDFAVGEVDHLTAERWTVSGMDFLELSIRIETGADDAATEQHRLEKQVQHLDLEFDTSKDPKTDRVMKHLAGLD